MYDDDVQPVMALGSVSKYTKVAKFPTRNIKTPIVLVYGGSDSLVDIDVMLRELPPHTIATEIPHYEHLDFLWAREVDTLVFPHVFDALESFSDAEHSKEEYDRYRSARHQSLGASAARPALPSSYISDDEGSQTYADIANISPGKEANSIINHHNGTSTDVSLPSLNARKRARLQNDFDDSSDASSPIGIDHVRMVSGDTNDNTNGYGNGRDSPTMRKLRRDSSGSNLSFGDHGTKGILLGAGRPVSAVSKDVEIVGNLTNSSDDGRKSEKKRGKR
jgi:lysosomal acid lipase/cholesteryl ester hydrolase